MRKQITPAVIGKRLAAIRKSYRISQADLAKNINLSRSAISRMETGKRQIALMEVVKMADYLVVMTPTGLAKELLK